ncbi:MAG: hypothetical protein ACRDT6_13670, partial [Micromonosporaceae bacterium]
ATPGGVTMTRAAPAAVGLSPERENAEPRVARLPLDTAVNSSSPARGAAAANRAAVINHAVNAFAALLGEPNDCDREHAHRAAVPA